MVVMAKNQFDVQVSVNFARINNVRLVIRNTGHDYLGRSTGYGALALNTHGLQTIQFMKTYSGPGNWSGSAVKVGAGVMFRDLYPQAQAQGVHVVGGESPVRLSARQDGSWFLKECTNGMSSDGRHRRRVHTRGRSQPFEWDPRSGYVSAPPSLVPRD